MPNYYVKLAEKTLQLAGTVDARGRVQLLQLIFISFGDWLFLSAMNDFADIILPGRQGSLLRLRFSRHILDYLTWSLILIQQKLINNGGSWAKKYNGNRLFFSVIEPQPLQSLQKATCRYPSVRCWLHRLILFHFTLLGIFFLAVTRS